MPSLFRFLMVVAVIVGIVYGVIFTLANFVNPKPREITVTIPADKFLKKYALGSRGALKQDLRCQTHQPVPRHACGRTGRRAQYAPRLSPRPDGFVGISSPPRPTR